jgi:DNA primase
MGLIPQTFIDELIARADIVEVIGSRVQLKKAGREYKACCPFHNEKSASFWVSPEKQFYHCFGCGVHGTVLRFLMEHDHMPFPEAVEELATRLGLEVPHDVTNGSAPGSPRRVDEPLYDLMGRVARFYADALTQDERAQQYVAKRGLDRETVEKFGIGYAPNSWNEVLRRFGGSDDARRALSDLGLIIERERGQSRDAAASDNRYYDRFRDRIMFPIRDGRGRIIAFGGRILDQGEPKYLNSPETVLFHKGRELYGLYEARRSRTNLRRLLIVEGYMDAVRLHQYGINYAVATLGTATTPEHLKRIFRLVSEVVFAFDGDRAGRAAAWRALQNALPEARQGREVRFLFLPDGHDPDSLVGEEGQEAFERRLDDTSPLSEYFVRELSEQVDLAHADGRAKFSESARPLWAKLPEGVYRELMLARIAEVVGIAPQRLQQLWQGSVAGAPLATQEPPSPARRAARSAMSGGRGSLVRQAVLRLVSYPAIALEVSAAEREALDSCEEAGIELLRELIDNLRAHPAQNSAQVIERWADKPDGEALQKLLQREQIMADAVAAAAELRAALHKLADQAIDRRLKELEAKSGVTQLTPEEWQEFQCLQKIMLNRSSRGARGG